jgi:hypothetical protein
MQPGHGNLGILLGCLIAAHGAGHAISDPAMNAQSNALPDAEQHWQELHATPSFHAADLLKSATDTLRRSPVLAVGGAAIVGFALGKLLLGGRGGSLSKLLAASALPLASKGLHHARDFVQDHAADTRRLTRKQWRSGLKQASHWLDSIKR